MRLLPFIFLMLFSVILFGQNYEKIEDINKYLENTNSLDPIEGIWTLNVIRTLLRNDIIVGQEEEKERSEWAIVRENGNRFKVIDIGKSSPDDKSSDMYAYFEKTNSKIVYNYTCNFYDPDWTAKAMTILDNENILKFNYFVSDVYMKDAYKSDYEEGLSLHWAFTWTKKYPISNKNSSLTLQEKTIF